MQLQIVNSKHEEEAEKVGLKLIGAASNSNANYRVAVKR